MAHIIDYTEARRARALPPTPLERARLTEMARIDLAEEIAAMCRSSRLQRLTECCEGENWDDLDGED